MTPARNSSFQTPNRCSITTRINAFSCCHEKRLAQFGTEEKTEHDARITGLGTARESLGMHIFS